MPERPLLRDAPNYIRQTDDINRFVGWWREYAKGVCHLRRVFVQFFGGRDRATADVLFDLVRWHVDREGKTWLSQRERTRGRYLLRSDRHWRLYEGITENTAGNIRKRLAELGVVTTEPRRSSLYRGGRTKVYTLHFRPLLRVCAHGALAMADPLPHTGRHVGRGERCARGASRARERVHAMREHSPHPLWKPLPVRVERGPWGGMALVIASLQGIAFSLIHLIQPVPP